MAITVQLAIHTIKSTRYVEKTFRSEEALARWCEQQEAKGKDVEMLRFLIEREAR